MRTSSMLPKLARAVFFATAALAIGLSVSAQDELNPHPASPAELLAAVDRADKLVVYNYEIEAEKQNQDILYSSSRLKDISELRQSLIIEPPKEWFRCACLPVLDIKLYRKGKEIGVVSLFGELTAEFSGWSGDVRIADREKLLRWFDEPTTLSPSDGLPQCHLACDHCGPRFCKIRYGGRFLQTRRKQVPESSTRYLRTNIPT